MKTSWIFILLDAQTNTVISEYKINFTLSYMKEHYLKSFLRMFSIDNMAATDDELNSQIINHDVDYFYSL